MVVLKNVQNLTSGGYFGHDITTQWPIDEPNVAQASSRSQVGGIPHCAKHRGRVTPSHHDHRSIIFKQQYSGNTASVFGTTSLCSSSQPSPISLYGSTRMCALNIT